MTNISRLARGGVVLAVLAAGAALLASPAAASPGSTRSGIVTAADDIQIQPPRPGPAPNPPVGATDVSALGNAPQCIYTSQWNDGVWNWQQATNNCGYALRVKLVWDIRSGPCQTLLPGWWMSVAVLRPAWPDGADSC